ncbi:MAG TPA: OsmC family protein [Polyangiaceae bacterium]|jgi:ribosomal protein S12 methylthiotransferase accessory factor|nr:MAG: OsmC-like protein [Deltaproteobacteria bacterium ADurb.Bin207]HNS99541.1 OsmC family protein [Polyangiaceae bacterium]HOE50732.1 OsmC family protein [Polyangiaceae bacterium]HOR37898.1 OsmC family protein [Polyangiaceae bacterium]HOT09669.1 OsmC family protein [Polyangiaceae bacterium]
MEMHITFAGGKRVNAEWLGRTIATDQAREGGGDGSAPEPYALFLASIGTCAGIYVLEFCRARNLPTEGISLVQRLGFNPVTHKLENVRIEIRLPPDFPEKYKKPVQRAADLCAVKRTILEPPNFEVVTVDA